MIDKRTTSTEALKRLQNGHSVMIGGFGSPGTPFTLINALIEQGAGNLTLIKNDANEFGIGISKIFEAGLADQFIVSHIGLNNLVVDMMNKGILEVEFSPQGILAERIRAGGSGFLGFLSDIGIDTILRENKRIIELEDGRQAFIEPALRADFALIHAKISDPTGNLIYSKSSRNFNPLMAMAADIVVAEVEEIVETGSLDPDSIHTTGAFIDHIVSIKELTEEYGVLEHHVIQG
ncbi:MAG: 3-oxoacid CoA-transferase subunit A [Desulfovermiculus sp.]|nr:3-oxoacid CoA-transferase subunit A [Desulfovermiculus sp.]